MQPDTSPAKTAKLAGLLMLVYALLWAGAAGYCGYKAYTGRGAPAPAEKKPDDPTAADDKKAEPLVAADPNFTHYVIVGVFGGLAAVVAAGGGAWVAAKLPPATNGDVSKAVLAVGGLTGLVLVVLSLWFFIDTFDILTKWLDKREAKQVWMPLLALFVGIAGAGVAFLAALPARQMEREDPSVRKLIYGSNTAVAGMLLLLLLVVGNVVASAKLPNRIDTTEEGFFTLQPRTAEFIQKLTTTVTAHVLLPESGPVVSDARRLVQVCQEANPDKFQVKYYSYSSPADARKLKAKFPQADAEMPGIILSVGDDETKYTQLDVRDFIKTDRGPSGRATASSFQGEPVLMKELVFLADSKTKAVVYFTQGNGELALAPPTGELAGRGRSMAAVKTYLDGQNIDCRPLPFDPAKPAAVPDDAVCVVVADPTNPLAPAAVESLRQYMTGKPGGKKGKLIVFSSPHPAAGGKGVELTGLEELLAEYNLTLTPAYRYVKQDRGRLPATVVPATVYSAAEEAKIGPARIFAETQIPLQDCRPLDVPRQGQGNPAYFVTPVLISPRTWVAWQSPDKDADPDRTYQIMIGGDQDLAQRLKATQGPRILAAAVAETGVGRVFVVASGAFLADPAGNRRGAENSDAGPFLTATIDWMRERGEVTGVTAKSFGFYRLRDDYDPTRLHLLPLAVGALSILAVGFGVWAVRRK